MISFFFVRRLIESKVASSRREFHDIDDIEEINFCSKKGIRNSGDIVHMQQSDNKDMLDEESIEDLTNVDFRMKTVDSKRFHDLRMKFEEQMKEISNL